MSRRSLLFGATFGGAMAASGLLSSCSWVTSEPAPPSPLPSSTPDEISESETPSPEETPTATPEASPTPALPPEQVLRVAGDLGGPTDTLQDAGQACFDFPAIRAGLLSVGEGLEVEADWAEAWESPDGGSTWIFRIRRNDQGWVSGSPLTTHDFVARWRALLDPELRHPGAGFLFDLENAPEVFSGEQPLEDAGVIAADDWTLEVTLTRPRQSFPILAASPLLAPRSGVDNANASTCDSNGPYYVAGERDGVLRLEPFENYWSSAMADLDRIEILPEGPARAIDRFRAGDADFVRISPADLPRVRSDVELRDWMRQGTPSELVALLPQVDTPPFDDPDIRRALGLLIDRSRLELIVEGRVRPARRLIAEGLFPLLDELGDELSVSFDIDTALELIERSEYPEPSEWPAFGLTIPEGDTYLERVARDVSSQFEENLGIEVPVELVGRDEYRRGLGERRFPLTWLEWSYRYADPACVYADLFASFLNPQRPVVWEDEEYDDLVRIADTFEDPDERAGVYAECEEILLDQGICIPLVHPVNYYLIQQWVRDVPLDSAGRVLQAGVFRTRFASHLTLTRRTR